jgi:hypothetical protein
MSRTQHLRTEPRLADPDGFYEALMEAHRGLSAEASRLLDARLVLLLANHVGEDAVLREAIALAAAPLSPGRSGGDPAASISILPGRGGA